MNSGMLVGMFLAASVQGMVLVISEGTRGNCFDAAPH